LTGAAVYTDDFSPAGTLHAAVLRSQYGHAGIDGIEPSNAEGLDDVVAVFTRDDIATAEAAGELTRPNPLPNGCKTPIPLLATERVRYVGEPVAVAVAQDRYTAADALDRIEVTYDRQDAVVDARDALADGAPTVQSNTPNNVAPAIVVDRVTDETVTAMLVNATPYSTDTRSNPR
jgi:carbon-monoxide dehydrogenase large subunit